ncbi:MAG: acyl-CoA thioesterase [Gammaproteobacteria bacterium]|jgi:acyl-CoA thioester hydrolase|nr:acyl-CoA thioesterase [Gammaproteobacteria bacterium]
MYIFAIFKELFTLRDQTNTFLWASEVRSYEVDLQGIVNNAHYFHYFDHVRVKHLLSKGVDWEEWHKAGFDLVLVHADIKFVSSLRFRDSFTVISKIEKISRLKILFRQTILRNTDNKVVAEALNTTVCVSTKTSRPIFSEKLDSLLFGCESLDV